MLAQCSKNASEDAVSMAESVTIENQQNLNPKNHHIDSLTVNLLSLYNPNVF